MNDFGIRHRTPPKVTQNLFGRYEAQMQEDEGFRERMRDRAAYVFVTGMFPSHLRKTSTAFLREITRPYRRPSSLDGRSGNVIVLEEAASDLQLNAHPMVRAVRTKIANGYFIQASRGPTTRRGYGKIYMFQMTSDSAITMRTTMNIDGSEKRGW